MSRNVGMRYTSRNGKSPSNVAKRSEGRRDGDEEGGNRSAFEDMGREETYEKERQ
jgi:hypothetical protein